MIEGNHIVPSEEEVFSRVLEEEVYRHYIGNDFEVGSPMSSPLREDDFPSFSVFYGSRAQKLMYKDFATGESGDCVIFVKRLFNLKSRTDALYKICIDFKVLTGKFDKDIIKKIRLESQKKYQKSQVTIRVKYREWNELDKEFWTQFGIKKRTLLRYNVRPIKFFTINGTIMPTHKLAYAYLEHKDGQYTYKIYQPYSSDKWMGNVNATIHQGYTQLPETGELLIITKSLKDVASIWDTLGYPAIGLQSESCDIKPSVVEEYRERFGKVFLLFDNDEPGQRFAKPLYEKHGLTNIILPKSKHHPKAKDYSDYIKFFGVERTTNYLRKICSK